MARLNVQIVDVAGHNVVPTRVFKTEAGATAIRMGEPVKLKAAASAYIIPLADAEPVVGTTTSVVGIAAGDSNHTASADGLIEVYMPLGGVIYRARAQTFAAIDTQAELDARLNDKVVFDLTSTQYTVDTEVIAAAASGLVIVGGSITAGTIDFTIRPAATDLN